MKKFVILGSLLLLTSCAAAVVRTTANSPVQGNGRPVGNITFVIDKHSGGPTLITGTTSNGEIFTGNAVPDQAQMEVDNGEGVTCTTRKTKKGHEKETCETYDRGTSVHNYNTGIWRATLLSNRGNSMNCTIHSAQAGSAIVYGAAGTCQVSDGRVIPVSLTNPVIKLDKNGQLHKSWI